MIDRIKQFLASKFYFSFSSSAAAPAFTMDPTFILTRELVEKKVRTGTLFSNDVDARLCRLWLHAHADEPWALSLLSLVSDTYEVQCYVEQLGEDNLSMQCPLKFDYDTVNKFNIVEWLSIEKQLLVQQVRLLTAGDPQPQTLACKLDYVSKRGVVPEQYLITNDEYVDFALKDPQRTNFFSTVFMSGFQAAMFTCIGFILAVAIALCLVSSTPDLLYMLISSAVNGMLATVASFNLYREHKTWYSSLKTLPWRNKLSKTWDDFLTSKNSYDLVLLSQVRASISPKQVIVERGAQPGTAPEMTLPGAQPADLFDFCLSGISRSDISAMQTLSQPTVAPVIEIEIPDSFQETISENNVDIIVAPAPVKVAAIVSEHIAVPNH